MEDERGAGDDPARPGSPAVKSRPSAPSGAVSEDPPAPSVIQRRQRRQRCGQSLRSERCLDEGSIRWCDGDCGAPDLVLRGRCRSDVVRTREEPLPQAEAVRAQHEPQAQAQAVGAQHEPPAQAATDGRWIPGDDQRANGEHRAPHRRCGDDGGHGSRRCRGGGAGPSRESERRHRRAHRLRPSVQWRRRHHARRLDPGHDERGHPRVGRLRPHDATVRAGSRQLRADGPVR